MSYYYSNPLILCQNQLYVYISTMNFKLSEYLKMLIRNIICIHNFFKKKLVINLAKQNYISNRQYNSFITNCGYNLVKIHTTCLMFKIRRKKLC